MENKELTDYIKSQKQRGVTDEDIKNELLKSGWQEEAIKSGFASLNAPTPTQPASQQPSTPSTADPQPSTSSSPAFYKTKLFRWGILGVIILLLLGGVYALISIFFL